MDKPETMAEWLKRVDKTQNLSKLSNLEDTVLEGDDIRYFESKVILPTGEVFHYDTVTEKYVLGAPDAQEVRARGITQLYDQSSSVAATKVYTVPANTVLKIVALGVDMDNRTTSWQLSINPAASGDTVTYAMKSAVGTQAGQTGLVVGGVWMNSSLDAPGLSLLGELWLLPGDVLTLTADQWIAGDTTTMDIIADRYVV